MTPQSTHQLLEWVTQLVEPFVMDKVEKKRLKSLVTAYLQYQKLRMEDAKVSFPAMLGSRGDDDGVSEGGVCVPLSPSL